ncbi:hypothetical protein Tco_1130999 [Tanacetum coccineum]
MRSHQNESLAIAGRNLFDDEASLSNNIGPKPPTPPKTLHEHSHPTSFDFQNPIPIPTEQTGRIVDSCDIWLIQNTCIFQELRTEDPLCHIKHYLSIVDNIQADEATRDTSRLRFFYFSLKGKVAEWLDRIPPTQVMTGSYEANECKQLSQAEQGNNKCKGKGEDGPEWTIRGKFEDELAANFMLEKKSQAKRIGDMLIKHLKELREQYSQKLTKAKTPEPEAPTFAITTRSGISTQDPPFPSPPRPATDNLTKGETKK